MSHQHLVFSPPLLYYNTVFAKEMQKILVVTCNFKFDIINFLSYSDINVQNVYHKLLNTPKKD